MRVDAKTRTPFDEFIHDVEPVAADRGVSHRILSLEHARVNDEEEWDSLISRARARGKGIEGAPSA
ncbi:hypothetical protein Hypma_000668 [Hypsizygus marmoreus]|uniref:Uncharacterized protein n=1 Tax=Hypsizygus marmoreus TaxID=39966 RepID=A0A369JA96_HYPMA|nr:hypothetical protein Hypma_000668 [Hypsizygus marmoreus]